ncbi:MAG: hypothetical protein MR902_05520 [Campylobacter sp.]|nr:hypothetical protein [Campylobacter sp.]
MATNNIIILVLFVPIVGFLLGVSNESSLRYAIFMCDFIRFAPLIAGIMTRIFVIKRRVARSIFRANFCINLTKLPQPGYI